MIIKGYAYLIKPLVTIIILFSIYLILTFSNISFIYLPRLKMQDFLWRIKYELTKPPKEIEQIVLVSIDDSAYDQYGSKWPWGREAFAGIIYNINKDKPRVIGLNLAFLGVTEREEVDDQILRMAFMDSGRVVGASYFGADGKYIVPSEYFSKALKDYGFTNKPIDIDNIIRYTKLFEPYKATTTNKLSTSGIFDYSLEIKLLCVYYNISPEDILYKDNKLVFIKDTKGFLEIPVNQNGLTILNYTARPNDLKIIPVLDVLYNKIPSGTFTDKIVLIGTKGKIFHEEILTPLGLFSGIEIVANSLAMILGKNFVHIMPIHINLILFTFIIGLVTCLFWRCGVIKNLFILFLSLIGISLFSLILVINDIVIDFFNIPLFILISYLGVEATKYGTLIIEEIKLKTMAILDPVTGLSTRRYFIFRLDNDIRRALREKRNLVVVLFSIDNYEQISSILGIDKTDLLLKRVGQLIKKNSRKTRRGDFIARYGEAVFGVILRDTTLQGPNKYVNRINKILEQTETGKEIKLSISTGITPSNIIKTESAMTFMKYAENALKMAGGTHNKIFMHDKRIEGIEPKEHEVIKPLDEIDLSFVAEELDEKNKELKELIKKLRTAYSEMAKNERLTAMGKLASSIHHELNNPLSALRTCLQTVTKNFEKQPFEEPIQKTKELVNSALEEIQRLIEMNKGLKDLYKPIRLVLEPVDLNKLINETLDFLRGELTKNKIDLITELNKEPPIIEVNKGELKQAFLNIILNAVDAMPGGGKLNIETALDKSGGNIEIKISDTGCGISPENMEKLFEPLFTTKEDKGAGLGLYVTKQKIGQHNGTIKVESQLNQGTTFTISLPTH